MTAAPRGIPREVVADTSAFMALLLGEAEAEAIAAVLESAATIVSAGTLAEALIVADRRGLGAEMARLIDGLGIEIEPLSPAGARQVAAAHARWGRGNHPAGLNFGDCCAYALARGRGWPLLYVGEGFARTDVTPALPPGGG